MSSVSERQERLYSRQTSNDDASQELHTHRWEMTSPMLSSPHYTDKNHLVACDVQHLGRARSQSLGSATDRDRLMVQHEIYDALQQRRGQQDYDEKMPKQLQQLIPPYKSLLQKSSKVIAQPIELPSEEEELWAVPQQIESFPLNDLPTPPPESLVYAKLAVGNPIWISIMYGMINATIVLPVLMSFGSIIYQNEAYQPYINQLIKLTIVSGMVHQICFSTVSSLPFAVGQVQDAGLIFLSSMATDMVNYCHSRDYNDQALLATATIGLGICTAVLGCGLILVGKLKLAQYVQQLPTCVIGGYLAYIGWFCGVSGLSIMAGVPKVTPTIFWNKIVFILPGLCSGILIYVLVRYLQHMAVLPTCIVILFGIFYLVLWFTNTTVADATQEGWIRPSDPPPSFLHTWDYLKFDHVVWSALPRLVGTELSMIFVVALSSSLDVAAIELELDQPLNYNHELTTVGLSNVISGLSGGYTGSYIFSQSIFSLRAGIRSPLAGYVLACCQLLILIVPFPVLAFVPSFFYGALLSLIWVDLMYEWLWEVRSRMTSVEYIISLVTFGSMHVLAVEWGILLGVGVYAGCAMTGINVGEPKSSIQSSNSQVKKPLNGQEGVKLLHTNGSSNNYGSLPS